MTLTDDLPTLRQARAYLRREGDEMTESFVPMFADDDLIPSFGRMWSQHDDVCVHGLAVRHLSRDRRKGHNRKAVPATTMETYDPAAYEVACRADDDREHAAELAAAIVVASRDSLVCDERLGEWQASVASGRRAADDPKTVKQVDHWEQRGEHLRSVVDDLQRTYLTGGVTETTTSVPRYSVTGGHDLLAMVAERHGWAAPLARGCIDDYGDAVLAVTAPQLATLLAECWQMMTAFAEHGDPAAVSDVDLHASLLFATCGVAVTDDLTARGAPLADAEAMAAAWARYLPLTADDLELTDQTQPERQTQ